MSLRSGTVAAIRRRLPELDEEAAWRGALSGAASLFLLLVAVAILIPLRDDLDTGSIALVLLLPPLVASNGGRVLSLVSALISALAFNFLFTQPYNSFRIESSASIAAFVIYVLIALVLASYVSGFRNASAAAARRALSMEQLQTLAVGLIRSDDLLPPLRRALSDLSGGARAARRGAARDRRRERDQRAHGRRPHGRRAARARAAPGRRAGARQPARRRRPRDAPHLRQRHHVRAARGRHGPPARGSRDAARCSSRSAGSSGSRSDARSSSTRACSCRRSRRRIGCAPPSCNRSRTTSARR